MRTNGFALLAGDESWERAERAVARIHRHATQVMVDLGEGFERFEPGKRRKGERVAVAYSLDDSWHGPPYLVHGYVRDLGPLRRGEPPEGEFAALVEGDGTPVAARDPLGTRPLYVQRGADGKISLATDHAFLEGERELLPPGAVFGRQRTTPPRESPERNKPSFEEAAATLAGLLDESVKERVSGRKRIAVSFSGGLDSSLMALLASRHADVILCSAYAEGSRDAVQVERGASLLDLELEASLLGRDRLVKLSSEMDLPFEPTLMDRALWGIYSTTSGLAREHSAEMIILGQLADELFGGYSKYAVEAATGSARGAEEMMRRDVKGCAERGFIRDEAACARWVEARFPFADSSVASFAWSLPLSYKIRKGGVERKAVLRAAARLLGLPEELASAPKKAAQFSSGAEKLLR